MSVNTYWNMKKGIALLIAGLLIAGAIYLYRIVPGQNPEFGFTASKSYSLKSYDYPCDPADLECWSASSDRSYPSINDWITIDGGGGGGEGGDGSEECEWTPDECWEQYQLCLELCDEKYPNPDQQTEHQNCYADCAYNIWDWCKYGIPPGCTP